MQKEKEKENKKYFIVSDVHSFYDEMIAALKSRNFDINNSSHIFVSLGDLFDRGDKSKECLDFVMSIPKDRRILIEGNHCELLKYVFKEQMFHSYDISNGTYKTFKQLYNGNIPVDSALDIDIINNVRENKKLKEYLDSLINYYETEHTIMCHAYLPFPELISLRQNSNENWDWREASDFLWKTVRWTNGFDASLQHDNNTGKDIIFGHWNTSYMYHKDDILNTSEFGSNACYDIYYGEDYIGIDACTVVSKKVNCLVITE